MNKQNKLYFRKILTEKSNKRFNNCCPICECESLQVLPEDTKYFTQQNNLRMYYLGEVRCFCNNNCKFIDNKVLIVALFELQITNQK